MNASHWDRVYAAEEELPWDLDSLPTEIARCLRRVPRNARVLDIGCGRGQHSRRIAALGYDVTGIDWSPVAIAQARELDVDGTVQGTVQFLCENVVTFTACDAFDLVIDYSVFHHIPESERTDYACSVNRNLRVGGYFLLVCYSDQDSYAHGRTSRVGDMGNRIFHPTKKSLLRSFPFGLVQYDDAILGVANEHTAHCLVFKKDK